MEIEIRYLMLYVDKIATFYLKLYLFNNGRFV